MTTNEFINLSIKDLLSLPERDWLTESKYDSLIVVPTNEKHDSGFRLMAIVGCINAIPKEIAAYCDDMIIFSTKLQKPYDSIHCDMILSNCIRFWSNIYNFKVGASLSSTDINLIRKENV